MSFEPWSGAYRARGPGYALQVDARGAEMNFGSGHSLALRFERPAAEAAIRGAGQLPGLTHYLVPGAPQHSRIGVPNFARAVIQGLYPGIDAGFDTSGGRLEFDFLLAPGADPGVIALRVEGAEEVSLTSGGEMEITAAGRTVRLKPPAAFQQRGTSRAGVEVAWNRPDSGRLSFRIGAFDRALPLVIDPVLEVSSYIGPGTGFDQTQCVSVDSAGNPVFAGSAGSVSFPTPSSPARPAGAAGYILRTTPDLKTVLSTTFIAATQSITGLAVDAAGAIYAGGGSAAGFSASGGGYQAPSRASSDAFVAKLDREGKTLVWTAVVGGSGQDYFARIAVNRAGEVYAAGSTTSGNLPVTAAAYQRTYKAGLDDGMVARFTAAGGLAWLTYLGGVGRDEALSIALDSQGNPVIAGLTNSADYPATPGAFQTAGRSTANNNFGTILNAVVTKLKADGSGLVWSTFLSGTGYEMAYGVALDDAGAVYVTGASGSKDFPTTPGAAKTTSGGSQAVFISKLKPDGSGLAYSTYLGGTGEALDVGYDIAAGPQGVAYVAGQIGPSLAGQKPVSGGVAVAFSAAVEPDGSAIEVNGFASTQSVARAIAVRAAAAAGTSAAGARAANEQSMAFAYVAGNVVANGLLQAAGFLTTATASGERGFGARIRSRRRAALSGSLRCQPSMLKSGDTLNLTFEVVNGGEGSSLPTTFRVDFGQTANVAAAAAKVSKGQVETAPDGVYLEAPGLAPGDKYSAVIPVPVWNTGRFQAQSGFFFENGERPGCLYEVAGVPKVEMTKSMEPPGPVHDGQTVEYVVFIANKGTAGVKGIRFSDVFPPGMVPLSASMSTPGDCDVHLADEFSGGQDLVVCRPRDTELRAGEGFSVRVKARAATGALSAGDVVRNDATLTWDGGATKASAAALVSSHNLRTGVGLGTPGFLFGVENLGPTSASGLYVRLSTANLAPDYVPPEMCTLEVETKPIQEVDRYFGAQSWLRPLLGEALVVRSSVITCPLGDLEPGQSRTLEYPLSFALPGVQNARFQVTDQNSAPVTETFSINSAGSGAFRVWPTVEESLNCYSMLFDENGKPWGMSLRSADGSLTWVPYDPAAGYGEPYRQYFVPSMELFRALPGDQAGGVPGLSVLGSGGLFFAPGPAGGGQTPKVTFTGGLRNTAFDYLPQPGGPGRLGVLQTGAGLLDPGALSFYSFDAASGWQPQRDGAGEIQRIRTEPLPLDLKFGLLSGSEYYDAVWANPLSGSISFAKGLGGGKFDAPKKIGVGQLPTGLAVTDLTGSGKKDIVVSHWGSQLQVVRWDESGEFRTQPPPPGDLHGVSPAAADFDGDGNQDIALAQPLEDRVAVLTGRGDGTFNEPVFLYLGQRPYFVTSSVLDGRPLILVSTAGGAGTRPLTIDFGQLQHQWHPPGGSAPKNKR